MPRSSRPHRSPSVLLPCFVAGLILACGHPQREVKSKSADDGRGVAAADSGATLPGSRPVDDAAAELPDAAAPSDGSGVELTIPLEPISEGSLGFFLTEDPDSGDFLPGEDTVVRLAVGDGYPDTMTFTLDSLVAFATAGTRFGNSLVLDSVRVTEGAGELEARVGDDGRLEIHAPGAGLSVLELEVSAELDDGSGTLTFIDRLTVDARRITSAELSTCSGQLVVTSGSPFGSTRLYALDEAGEVFSPANAGFDREATLRVRARAGTSLVAPLGVDSLVATGPSQTVAITSHDESVADFELIQPDEVDSFEPRLASDQGGTKGGGAILSNGDELTVDLAGEPYLSVFPGARFGDTALCGGPAPTLFELRSTTPDVCVIDPDGCATRGCNNDRFVPATANLIATGTCTVEVSAPTLNHGNGLAATLSVDVKTP